MRNFLKTMCILLVVNATGFAQFAQTETHVQVMNMSPQHVQSEIKRYTKMKQAGMGLIITGSTSAVTSLVFGIAYKKQFNNYDNLKPRHLKIYYDASGNAYYDIYRRSYDSVSFGLLYATPGFFAAGIPLRVAGVRRVNALKNALPNSAYVAPNGVNFTWNF